MPVPLDQIFSTTTLNVLVPNSTLEFPPEAPVDEWFARAQSAAVDRRQAFFDEQLLSFLVLRIKHPEDAGPADPKNPPDDLLDLLAHIQVSLEATYISSVPTADTPRTSRLLGTPKTGALARPNRLNAHPSILPPNTPNPMPATGDQDRKYVTAEGTLLVATIWGANTAEDSPEAFALEWSEEQRAWLAIYRMAITVSFLRLAFSDPLLCITASATLREKAIPTSPKHPLSKYLASLPNRKPQVDDKSSDDQAAGSSTDEPRLLDGLDEVNLLDGLLASTTFSQLDPSQMNLPSKRLGTTTRQNLFSLPPILTDTPVQPSPSPMTAVRKAHPTMRKSFRKTLQTASGFRVRMRTVFVPFILLPETESTVSDVDEESKQRERQEAGSEERTVVLCVEVENSGDLGKSIGFLVERIQVTIGGEGAKATLIGWGDHGFSAEGAKDTFPLRIAPLAQFNLLYAVTFTRSPEEIDSFSFARPSNSGISPELQRAVSINVFGKPYFPLATQGSMLDNLITKPAEALFPTNTYSSKWNCVLDLATQQNRTFDPSEDMMAYPNVLPEPASPFPGYSAYTGPRTAGTPGFGAIESSTPQYSATAGSKRFSLAPGASFAGKTLKNLTPTRSGVTSRPGESPLPSGARPPSVAMSNPSSAVGAGPQAHYLRSPTTYSMPQHQPLPPIQTQIKHSLSIAVEQGGEAGSAITGTQFGLTTGGGAIVETPTTAAYPAFPPRSALPPTPMSQGPIASAGVANFGTSVEVRRERGLNPTQEYVGIGGALPPTPLPHVAGAFGEQRILDKLQNATASGENVVVSVGLLPPPRGGVAMLGPGKIYPLDTFTLDIFVFNQSVWTRRFEITCPEKRRRRRGGVETGVYEGNKVARKMGYPGVLPMESRVRIGPLRPSACQSVRMSFLAVTPGVHSIDTLTLTDIETSFATNLRSVLDIVVHDPRD